MFFCRAVSSYNFFYVFCDRRFIVFTALTGLFLFNVAPFYSQRLQTYYRTVLISPRYANFFDPLAVCREQFKYLSDKGLAKLAL
jgi:uncharacterized protein YqhQ